LDYDCNLLFYTIGVDVYNRNHQLMLNGDNIGGHISASQVIIIPQPGSNNLYYIFTTDGVENNLQAGYNYSLVDMNLDNGYGQVTGKRILLNASCTEKMAAVRHANGIDVWFIANEMNSNIFKAWLITCSGLQPAPVISTEGAVLNQHRDINAGVLQPSPDGKLICQTQFSFYDDASIAPNFIQVFDFDNSTGILSNARSIFLDDAQYSHCAFSADSKFLYATRPYDRKLDQFEISLPSLAAIIASRIAISTNFTFHDIKLGPDEKIYVTRPSGTLGVINYPTVKGVGCDFQPLQFDLSPGGAFICLPTYVNDVVSVNDPNNGFSFTILDSCAGQVRFNAYTILPPNVSWSWDFGDGTTSAIQNPVHTFPSATQMYAVKLKITSSLSCGQITRTRRLVPGGLTSNSVGFDFVNKCDSGYIRFTNTSSLLQQPGVQFTWTFGDGSTSGDIHPVHTYTSPGTYQVKLKKQTAKACFDDSVTHPVKVEGFTVSTIPDQVITVGQTVLLAASGPQGSYKWIPSIWLNNPNIKNPVATPLEDIMYKVTVTDTGGCYASDSVFIKVIQYNDIYMPNAFTPNNDGKNDVIRPFYPGTITLSQFSIFNRYGQKVFSTAERNKGWDGKIKSQLQASGVYVWIINAKDKAGNNIERKGSFTCIRGMQLLKYFIHPC